DSKTPILALKEWQKKRPELFVKRVYEQAGLDNYDRSKGRIAIRPKIARDGYFAPRRYHV
ncbi:hypothetical protein ABIB42_002937, partial [Massilia sp. UYP32]|uniref:hypothetical protein n=1 Tax=Massilia sp. UYP32 TaxID=1756386 RepID=UPI003D21DA8C